MNPILRDLLDHQIWADVQHWDAIRAHPPAAADKALRDRLYHLHLVQRAFVWVVGDRAAPFEYAKPEELTSMDALRAFARGSHDRIVGCRDGTSEARLGESLQVPWFNDPPLRITVAEALTQMAMHSQWHRGQNATRLRELGAEPPTVDLIAWYWKGRPSAAL